MPLSDSESWSTVFLNVGGFDYVVAHFSFPEFDDGVKPKIVATVAVTIGKFVLLEPCVLFAKLNSRIPLI